METTIVTALGPEDVKGVFLGYRERLLSYRDAIDALNVFPVPDGDTGTNMLATVVAAVERMDGASAMGEVADALIRGSLLGARGNSGIILSQSLRGLAQVFAGGEEVDAHRMSQALQAASHAAYQAVLRPKEGTILTVLRESAEAIRLDGRGPVELHEVLDTAYRKAVETLAHTREMLPALTRAGVVDAGGAGIVLLLASFLERVVGTEVELPNALLRAREGRTPDVLAAVTDGRGPRYEVTFLFEGDDESLDTLRERWSELGDSIVLVGGEDTYRCHIHTDASGSAIEAAASLGSLRTIEITDLWDQISRLGPRPEARPEALVAPIGVVAVAAGAGLAELFYGLGAQAVVTGGQSLNPSTGELLEAVEASPARRLILLPNNRNIVPVAEHVHSLTTKTVRIVPTMSIPEGIEAMSAYLPGVDELDRIVAAMTDAAEAVSTGEITRAVRDSVVEIGSITKGEWVGLVDGRIEIATSSPEKALRALLRRLVRPESETVTIYVGADADRTLAETMGDSLNSADIRLEVLDGGQPLYEYLVAVL